MALFRFSANPKVSPGYFAVSPSVLVLANNQGELSPLEYGIHVLKYVELSEGGRGKKGGLSEYARAIGRSQPYVTQCSQGAKVISQLMGFDPAGLLSKSQHLAAIHKAPEQYWQQLTELLIEKQWSADKTEKIVNAIKEVDIPEVLHGFLVPEVWVKKAIAGEVTPSVRNYAHVRNLGMAEAKA